MVPTTIEPQDKPIEHRHFIPGVDMPQWKIRVSPDRPSDRRALDREPLLYHRAANPGQTRNHHADEPAQRDRMRTLMHDMLTGYGAPPKRSPG